MIKNFLKNIFSVKPVKNKLIISCSCDNGMIYCPGCKDADERDKVKYVCAGCGGSGVRDCGKCDGNNI